MVQGVSCSSSEKVMEKKVEKGSQMTLGEAAAASTLVMAFVIGLLCLDITMPDSDYTFLKLPRTLQDLQLLRDELERYTSEYTAQVLVGYCLVYIFMHTLIIPGTVFLSLLAGALFGVLKGLVLVVCIATVGASSCYFLVKTRWSSHCVVSLARQAQILPKPSGKEKGEYVELYAFSETDSNVTSYIHKCCFTHGGCAFSYIFPGNFHWNNTCCFCHSQGRVNSWRVEICGGSVRFQLNGYIVSHWNCFICAHTDEQEQVIVLQRLRLSCALWFHILLLFLLHALLLVTSLAQT